MINIPLTKLLFLDIETVGIQPEWDSLESNRPELAFQFKNYLEATSDILIVIIIKYDINY